MQNILAVGQDEHLLSTRQRVLKLLQADVMAVDKTEAACVLATRRFDIVVLCHTLTASDVAEIASIARRYSTTTRILQLLSNESKIVPFPIVDDSATIVTPYILVSKVRQMLCTVPSCHLDDGQRES